VPGKEEEPKVAAAVYDAYEPLVWAQAAAAQLLHFETFDAALDEFYSKVGGVIHAGDCHISSIPV
jgi:hypothetical protein